ncbi:hypothetical protein [Actinacidiphila sp. ITFR-21]|uniref:hypothetical protein n=1 Tax=Actinacidiphila sp. ITFR-21 TaxID=3075199 RepID=UPI0037D9FFC4
MGADTDSNAWAVSGLNACGLNPPGTDFTSAAHKTPIDFLIAQQFSPGGGLRYLPTDTGPSAYASIDALRTVTGGGFTAAPPVPVTPGAPAWVTTTGLTSGTTGKFALVVDDGSGSLKVCSVPVTATGATTTLGAVPDAATASATPGGCVTAVTPASGTGTVTALNGKADTGTTTWKSALDGSTAVTPARGTTVHLGATPFVRATGVEPVRGGLTPDQPPGPRPAVLRAGRCGGRATGAGASGPRTGSPAAGPSRGWPWDGCYGSLMPWCLGSSHWVRRASFAFAGRRTREPA